MGCAMKLNRLEQVFDPKVLPKRSTGLVRVNDESEVVKLYFPLSCYSCAANEDVLEGLKNLYPGRPVEFGFWHGPAHLELACSVDFGQLTRAVLNRSEVFWNMDGVTIIVDRALFNISLGDFVRKQIKSAVAEVSGAELKVIIQCKK